MSKVPKKIQKLRNARLAAVQAFYMCEQQSDATLDDILEGFINGDIGSEVLDENLDLETETFLKIIEPDNELLTLIVNNFIENQQYIDDIISNAFDDRWDKNRLELVLKSILRAAVIELIYRPDIDIPIIINEYIGITQSFYDDNEIKILHAILHKISNVVR